MTFEECAGILLSEDYTFAKSMPKNPHWYTLRKNWGNNHFEEVVRFIRENSFTEYFHGKPFKMFKLNGYKYWTMGAPLSETILINRAVHIEHNEYDAIADQYQTLFLDPESEAENREVISKIDIRGRVLDIGCGSGLLLDYADILPKNYVGIDPSEGMLNYFKRKHPDHITLNCAFEDFFPMVKFDTIISMFGSPSYILPEYLHRIKEMLAPGGTAFLMFYKNDYVPVTYLQTGVRIPHFENHTPGEDYHNYKIVRL